jgi:hypothetical protein
MMMGLPEKVTNLHAGNPEMSHFFNVPAKSKKEKVLRNTGFFNFFVQESRVGVR